MKKFITKAQIGDFFAKMYEANKDKNVEVTLLVNESKIEVYNKEHASFDYINILDEVPTIDDLVKSVSE